MSVDFRETDRDGERKKKQNNVKIKYVPFSSTVVYVYSSHF